MNGTHLLGSNQRWEGRTAAAENRWMRVPVLGAFWARLSGLKMKPPIGSFLNVVRICGFRFPGPYFYFLCFFGATPVTQVPVHPLLSALLVTSESAPTLSRSGADVASRVMARWSARATAPLRPSFDISSAVVVGFVVGGGGGERCAREKKHQNNTPF